MEYESNRLMGILFQVNRSYVAVIPAQAGIQGRFYRKRHLKVAKRCMDSGLRRNDGGEGCSGASPADRQRQGDQLIQIAR